MCSRVMEGDWPLIYGTGLLGSLMYSSKGAPDSAGAFQPSLPLACRYRVRASASLGGQASSLRHWLVPVSKTKASGSLGSSLPFSQWLKNGNSISSRKKTAVLEPKCTLPRTSPSERDQPP